MDEIVSYNTALAAPATGLSPSIRSRRPRKWRLLVLNVRILNVNGMTCHPTLRSAAPRRAAAALSCPPPTTLTQEQCTQLPPSRSSCTGPPRAQGRQAWRYMCTWPCKPRPTCWCPGSCVQRARGACGSRVRPGSSGCSLTPRRTAATALGTTPSPSRSRGSGASGMCASPQKAQRISRAVPARSSSRRCNLAPAQPRLGAAAHACSLTAAPPR